MTRAPTAGELAAAMAAIHFNQGDKAADAFKRASKESQAHRVHALEESASRAAQNGCGANSCSHPGKNVQAILDAGMKAGTIDQDGKYVGPDNGSEAVAAKDPETAKNACC
jgi:hypothetical protein